MGGRTKVFFLELTKIQRLLEKSPEELTKPEKWALYLKFVNDPKRRPIINQLIEEERGLAMASTKLQQITKDDNLRIALFSREKAENDKIARELYFRKIGLEQGLKEGIEKGIEQGIEKGIQKGIQKGIEKGLKRGRQEGLQEGRQEGRQEACEEMARQMAESGIPLKNISEITKISLERLKELLNIT